MMKQIESKKPGRPTVMTNETLKLLEDAWSRGCTDLQACLHANISHNTLYRFLQENKEFSDRKKQLTENVKLHARMNIADNIIDKRDIETSKWYLERREKNDFSQRNENINVEIPVPLIDIDKIRAEK